MSLLLKMNDKKIEQLIKREEKRQQAGLSLIASENIASRDVLTAAGSVLTNKYSEGYPGKRYYGGNKIVDEIETLAIEQVKKLFGAEHANVQPHSGSTANAAAYLALMNPGDTFLAMSLSSGGHLTHGAAVNFSGKWFKPVWYGLDPKTEMIDYAEVRLLAEREKPKVIVAGYTAYPRLIDFKKFREIADSVGAYLMIDMSHFAGLVAAGVYPNPVPYADVVTSTTHKTLRGPRGAFILCKTNLAKQIDKAVFPGMQGGPLDHIIAAKAVCFSEAMKPNFKKYGAQVIKNAKVLGETFTKAEFNLVSGGTDSHLILVKLKDVFGQEAEALLEESGIYVNKNLIPNDSRSSLDPSGLRLGTASVTTRGMKEKEMILIGNLICKILSKKMPLVGAKKQITQLAEKFPIKLK